MTERGKNKSSGLEVRLGKLKLKNPVMTASGTAGYGAELSEFFDLSKLGAIVLKGISLEPWQGNPGPRITETRCGMINSIGLQNVGLDVFLAEKLPFIRQWDVPVIANILGTSAAEYIKIASALEDTGIDGIELNVSCPNVKEGGIAFGLDIKSFSGLVRAVRKKVKTPALIVKLAPGAPGIEAFSRAAEEEGADAISLINTIPAMAIDVNTRRPLIKNKIGGLSGPAIKPIAVRMVYQAFKAVKIPVIGMGGITTGEDAVEFMLAGASAVAIGTATFMDPLAALKVIEGIEAWMDRHGVKKAASITGAMLS
ncbi:MAG: dihydroorotate dehydrogenase [Nitrospiraceae bacterium]|nr:dihydroorotate dehydrogenase [Nitrospiraceae bacterium]